MQISKKSCISIDISLSIKFPYPRSFAQNSFERVLRNSVRMEKQIGKMAGEGQKHGILFLCITHLLNAFGSASIFFCVHGTSLAEPAGTRARGASEGSPAPVKRSPNHS